MGNENSQESQSITDFAEKMGQWPTMTHEKYLEWMLSMGFISQDEYDQDVNNSKDDEAERKKKEDAAADAH